MRWSAVAALLTISACHQQAQQPAANQANTTENTPAETNTSASNVANAAENVVRTRPPSDAALRFVGTWAKDKSSCASIPWRFTKEELNAADGPHCSIYNVKATPGGYDLAVQCPAKKPDPTDLIKLRFAESARAMLVESNAIPPMGLIYCGK